MIVYGTHTSVLDVLCRQIFCFRIRPISALHWSNPDFSVAHTIRELALCRDDNYNFC